MEDSTQDLVRRVAIVHRMARDLAGNAHEGEDAAQEAFVAAIEKPPRESRSLRAWFATVLRRKILRSKLEQSSRRTREMHAAGTEEGADPGAIAAERDLVKLVIDAVYDLDEPYRRTMLLRYLEDREIADVARELSVPSETVRTRIKRGLDRVRARLDREHPSRAAWLVPLVRIQGAIETSAVVGTTIGLRMVVAAVAVAAALFYASVHEFDGRARGTAVPLPPPKAPELAITANPQSVERNEVELPKDAGEVLDPLAGRIVDASHRPIPNASLRLLLGDLSDAGASTSAPLLTAKCDDDGRFSLPGISGQDYVLAIEAKGFSARVVPVTGHADLGDVMLRKSFAIHGVVRDLKNRPVAGATVRFKTVQSVFYRELSAQSASDGSYRIDDASDPAKDAIRKDAWTSNSTSQFLVEHSAYAPLEVNLFSLLGFDEAGDLRFDPFLTRGATLVGTAIDAETHEGLRGATITLRSIGAVNLMNGSRYLEYPFKNQALETAQTDDLGRFSIARIPAWSVQDIGMHSVGEGQRLLGSLDLALPGFAAIDVNHLASQIRVPDEGQTIEFDIKALPTGTLRGRVVDANGNPIEGAEVGIGLDAISDSEGRLIATTRSSGSTTDASGAFEFSVALLRNLDSRGELSVNGESIEPRTLPVEGLRASSIRDLGEIATARRTSRPPLARLLVTDEGGRPVARARVEVLAVDNETNFDGPDACTLRTDSAGEAVMTSMRNDLVDPLLKARVIASGFETKYSGVFRAGVEKPPTIRVALAPLRNLSLDVEPAKVKSPLAATIEVTVLDATTSEPIVHVHHLSASDGHGHGCDGVEISPGVYRLSPTALGEWSLYVRVEGFAAHARQTVVLDSMDAVVPVTIRLERGAKLRVHVTASDGSHLAGNDVWLAPLSSGRTQTAKLDANQRFEASGFRAGERYELTIAAFPSMKWFTPANKSPIVIPTTCEQDLEVRVVPSGYAFVTSTDPRLGMPSSIGGENAAMKEFDSKSFLAVRDSSGNEVVRHALSPCTGIPVMIPYGTYVFRLEVFGDAPKEKTITIDRSDQTNVEFDVD